MKSQKESIESLFIELVCVAIGTHTYMSYMPNAKEWKALYELAKKQSLIGICFSGIQKLGADADDGFAKIGLPEMLYLKWMGMAANIQRRNEVVNSQCVELQERLTVEGFRSCVLKGQGVAQLYDEILRPLRQSGDIDVWVDANEEDILRWVRQYQKEIDFDYKHVHLNVYEGTSIEVHYRPSTSRVPWYLHRVEQFSKEYACWDNGIELGSGKINVPSTEFNIVFIMQHIFGHLFAEEMSLKQYLDYYYVLQQAHKERTDVKAAYQQIKHIGMGRFAQATMWLLHEVFRMPEEWAVCKADEEEGRFLLERVMTKETIKAKGDHGSVGWHLSVFKKQQCKNLHLLTHYPMEVIWAPAWLIKHYFWKRFWKLKHKELF